MGYNQRSGFTLIELIMVIAILGVATLLSGFLMIDLIRDTVFLSNQLNADLVVSDALDILVEGDSQAKGLRASRQITAVAADQVDFINQDNQTIRYRFDPVNTRLYRSINGGPETVVPYYLPAGVTYGVSGGQLFSYFDVNEAATNNPAQVRFISMTLVGYTGDGSFNSWEGNSQQSSAIAVPRFQ